MIKSLFDEGEEKSQTKIEPVTPPETQTEQAVAPEDEVWLEIPDSNDAATTTDIQILPDAELTDETITQPALAVSPGAKKIDELRLQSNISNSRNPTTEMPAKDGATFFQTKTKPESFAETARKSGLAMSAAIALFGSVVFLLVIGWFADLLLGTTPWGKIGGIVVGSIIGFFQFFRMTSQILKNKD